MFRRGVLLSFLLCAPLVAQQQTQQFHVQPVRPIAELRAAALKSAPPAEKGQLRKPDLVELIKVDPSIKLDIHYASTNNFLGVPLYEEAKAFMERPAAEAAARASRKLHEQGLGLLVFDAYRPWYVTKIFWDATPAKDHDYVANPADGSRHNRGCAVDLTIYDLKTNQPISMPSSYDEFSQRAHPDYAGGTAEETAHRELLRKAMEAEGFTVYQTEWWHFDYKDWKQYPLVNVPFAQIR